MKPAYSILIAVVLSAIVAYATVTIVDRTKGEAPTAAVHESAYDRVMRTKTIRCGYGVWEPGIMKDPNTGQLSGIFYDYMQAVGRITGLKIDWSQEVGWGDYPTALATGKIDAMCASMWPKAILATQVLFTTPVYYLPIKAFARANDNRFDQALEKANAPDIRISVMDSELSSQIAKAQFPQASEIEITQLTDSSMLMVNVANNKADLTFTDAWTGASFMEKNPGQLKAVDIDHPLRLYGNTIALAQGEQALANTIDTAATELINSGEMHSIIQKYAKIPGVLLVKEEVYE